MPFAPVMKLSVDACADFLTSISHACLGLLNLMCRWVDGSFPEASLVLPTSCGTSARAIIVLVSDVDLAGVTMACSAPMWNPHWGQCSCLCTREPSSSSCAQLETTMSPHRCPLISFPPRSHALLPWSAGAADHLLVVHHRLLLEPERRGRGPPHVSWAEALLPPAWSAHSHRLITTGKQKGTAAMPIWFAESRSGNRGYWTGRAR